MAYGTAINSNGCRVILLLLQLSTIAVLSSTNQVRSVLILYNNRIVKMATGRGLGGWTDGRALQTQAASGDLQAGIEGSRGGGGVTYEDGRARGYKQGWADGRAGRRASRWPKSSQRAILARNNNNSNNNNTSVSIYRHKVKLLFFPDRIAEDV